LGGLLQEFDSCPVSIRLMGALHQSFVTRFN
jgi:hypothetical protein